MPSSVPQMAREAAWSQRQAHSSHADSARAEAQRLAVIAAHFTFAKDDGRRLLTAAGHTVQLAMNLIGPDGRTRTVVARVVDGLWQWEAENMGGCPFSGWDLIEVVRQRIGARLASQLSGKAVLQ